MNHLLPVYNPVPIRFEKGRGCWLYDDKGDRWLDCISGIATNALGHCHPSLVAALKSQAERVWHISNALTIAGQEELGARLADSSFAAVAFFANSGTEAIECAIKLARRYHSGRGSPERADIISFVGAFHGRSYAAMNAGNNLAHLAGFGPLLPGYVQVVLEDHAALEAAVASASAAAVIVEPVQGEGGARALSDADLQRIRAVTRRHGVLLIHDEVQCGMGRTGRLYAHQWVQDAEPDIMALAKALGGGFPVGACLASAEAASGMAVGAHGSTFGGNPLAMAVALAAFEEIARPELLANVQAMSELLRDGLETIRKRYPRIVDEIRGKGLLVGVRVRPLNKDVIAAAREHKLLLAGGGDNCVRLLPPLNISSDEVEQILVRLAATCEAMTHAALGEMEVANR